MLSDGDLIRNLIGTYCERIDAADHAGVGALFGEDGVVATEDGTVLARGAAEIAAFFSGLVKLHDGRQRTTHLTTNVVLSEEADGSVTARSTYLVLQATDAPPLQPIITGRYVDRFAPDGDGGWSWIERRYSTELVGHLSEHLGQL